MSEMRRRYLYLIPFIYGLFCNAHLGLSIFKLYLERTVLSGRLGGCVCCLVCNIFNVKVTHNALPLPLWETCMGPAGRVSSSRLEDKMTAIRICSCFTYEFITYLDCRRCGFSTFLV